MSCNNNIHNEFKNMGFCPFCDQQAEDYISVKKDDPCCENKDLKK